MSEENRSGPGQESDLGHVFRNGVCSECGNSEVAARHFGWRCRKIDDAPIGPPGMFPRSDRAFRRILETTIGKVLLFAMLVLYPGFMAWDHYRQGPERQWLRDLTVLGEQLTSLDDDRIRARIPEFLTQNRPWIDGLPEAERRRRILPTLDLLDDLLHLLASRKRHGVIVPLTDPLVKRLVDAYAPDLLQVPELPVGVDSDDLKARLFRKLR